MTVGFLKLKGYVYKCEFQKTYLSQFTILGLEDTKRLCHFKMTTHPSSVTVLDSDEDEEILGYRERTVQLSPLKRSQFGDEDSSSSTVTATSPASEQEEKDPLSISSEPTSPCGKVLPQKIFISKKIFKSPIKLSCEPSLHPIKRKIEVISSSRNNNGSLVKKPTKVNKPIVLPESCISTRPDGTITKPVLIHVLEGKNTATYALKAGTKLSENQIISASLTKQKITPAQIRQKLLDGSVKTRIITGPSTDLKGIGGKSGISNKKVVENLTNNIALVSDESDPLYIPENKNTPSLKQLKLSTLTPTADENIYRDIFCNKTFLLPNRNKSVRSLKFPKQDQERTIKVKKKPQYSILKNPVVQKTISNKERTNSKDVTTNLLECTPQINSDYCRNFFIKNSAWDYLEPKFKGFNEREKTISQCCSNYFREMIFNMRTHQCQQEHNYSGNDLFFTRKIEFLDSKGKLNGFLIPSNYKKLVKRKIHPPSYYYPPTKKCKIVLERNEVAERKVKQYLVGQALDSCLISELVFTQRHANKPLLILNKFNFTVLKINEALCRHSHIIYVKNALDKYPEKLLDNSYLVSKMKEGAIKLVTPDALTKFFM